MLDSAKLVGFIPTKDYDQARAYYVDKLGFQLISLDQFGLVVSAGPTKIRITKIPNFIPLEGTTLGWEVEDVAAVAKWLASRGVPTEKFLFVEDRDLGI